MLTPATGAHLAQILAESHALWSEGLSPAAYARFWDAQMRTPWGSAHLDRVALVDGDGVVCSAKRYDLRARLDGRICRVLGIGAVFTSPSKRGRGAARELMHRLLEDAATKGYDFAALFSEIDPAFYARLDFVPVPLVESRVLVHRRPGAPAMLVRTGVDRDLAALAQMSASRGAAARLALERSEDFIGFGITKRRLLAGLGPPGLRALTFLVVEEGHTAVAYVVCSQQKGRWFIEDGGDRDPAGARLGALLQTVLSGTPGERLPEIRAWWPQGLSPPQLEIVEPRPTTDVLMARPLRNRALPPLRAEDVVYWRLDYF